jgi:Fic family protein
VKIPQDPPPFELLLSQWQSSRFLELLSDDVAGRVTQNGRYRHWDTLRNRRPPNGLDHQEWWFAVKMARRAAARNLELTSSEGRSFSYVITDEMLAYLHGIDQGAAGQIALSENVVGDSSSKQRYLVNSLVEEAIRSSQLEGASTTRKVAKEMIRSGRKPADRSERMISNNYRAMEFVRDCAEEQLTPEMLLELHRILTHDSLDNPDAAGRFQAPDE